MNDDNEPIPEVKADAFASWAIIEAFGHIRLAGKVSEAELFGGKMCRIDIPLAEGKWLTRYFGLASIFSLTPTDEAVARAVAASCSPEPVHAYEMPRLETVPPRDEDYGGDEDHEPPF